METLPLGLRLAGRRVLVAGGGTVAQRRIPALLAAGAEVVLVSPWITPTLDALAAAGRLTHLSREYVRGDVDGAWLVLALTDDAEANALVAVEAEDRRIFCVRADDASAATAWTPAVGRHDRVTVAVHADRDPLRAASVRDQLIEKLADGSLAAPRRRPAGSAVEDALAGEAGLAGEARLAGEAGSAGFTGPAGAAGEDRLAGEAGSAGFTGPSSADAVGITGTAGLTSLPGVALVGGGPGDPELITVRGRRLLARADVVVVDRLAPHLLLDELPSEVEVIDAAKIPYGRFLAQEVINRALVENALAGKFVVRLKGGDPFVFGRGGEELEACLTAGVPVEVVPGVTSAVSVPASAGIPVTQRGMSHEFVVVSGHVAPDDPASLVDWQALARLRGTLVLMMAVERLDAITRTLIAHGRPASTPVAMIQDGTTNTQRSVSATLETIVKVAADAGIGHPAVVVIGEVVAFGDRLATLTRSRR